MEIKWVSESISYEAIIWHPVKFSNQVAQVYSAWFFLHTQITGRNSCRADQVKVVIKELLKILKSIFSPNFSIFNHTDVTHSFSIVDKLTNSSVLKTVVMRARGRDVYNKNKVFSFTIQTDQWTYRSFLSFNVFDKGKIVVNQIKTFLLGLFWLVHIYRCRSFRKEGLFK